MTDRIRALLKSYRPERQAEFRQEFGKEISKARSRDRLTPEDVERLTASRQLVESWYGEGAPGAKVALAQWLEFYEAQKGQLSERIIEVLLGKVPKATAKEIDWQSLLLGAADRRLVEMLVRQKVLKAGDIIRVAKANPKEFYRSPALDALLEAGKPVPRIVWKGLEDSDQRPAGLESRDEALATSFSLDAGNDAVRWFTSFLAVNHAWRRGILKQLLREAGAALRLTRGITAMGMTATGTRKKAEQSTVEQIVSDLLPLCEEAIAEQKQTAGLAATIISLLNVSFDAAPEGATDRARQDVSETAGRVLRPLVTKALQAADSGNRPDTTSEVLGLSVGDLYVAVQDYLGQLMQSEDTTDGAAGRGERYERYLGRREVLERLLPLMDLPSTASAERDAIEAVLFNAGVRPMGLSGDTATFDEYSHEALDEGILPGEPVIVVHAGWSLGTGGARLVLKKAQVRAA